MSASRFLWASAAETHSTTRAVARGPRRVAQLRLRRGRGRRCIPKPSMHDVDAIRRDAQPLDDVVLDRLGDRDHPVGAARARADERPEPERARPRERRREVLVDEVEDGHDARARRRPAATSCPASAGGRRRARRGGHGQQRELGARRAAACWRAVTGSSCRSRRSPASPRRAATAAASRPQNSDELDVGRAGRQSARPAGGRRSRCRRPRRARGTAALRPTRRTRPARYRAWAPRLASSPDARCQLRSPSSWCATTAPTRSARTLAGARAPSCAPDDEVVVVDNALARRDPARPSRGRSAGARRRGRRRTSASPPAATLGARADARAAAPLPQPRRRAGPGCLDALRAAAVEQPGVGRLAGARDAGRRRARQHGRQRRALARLRLGGRPGRARSPTSTAAPRGRLRLGRGAGRPPRGVGRGGRLRRALLHVRRGPRPVAAAAAGRAGASASCRPRASRTTTSSPRATTSGSTSSATAGGRCSAPTRRRCSRCVAARRCSRSRSALLVAAWRGGWLRAEAARPGRGAARVALAIRRRRAVQGTRTIRREPSRAISPPRWTRRISRPPSASPGWPRRSAPIGVWLRPRFDESAPPGRPHYPALP